MHDRNGKRLREFIFLLNKFGALTSVFGINYFNCTVTYVICFHSKKCIRLFGEQNSDFKVLIMHYSSGRIEDFVRGEDVVAGYVF